MSTKILPLLQRLKPDQMAQLLCDFADRKIIVSEVTVERWMSVNGCDAIIPIQPRWSVQEILDHAG